MDARKLVGMTQGARKRAWLAGRIDATVFPDGINTDELEMKSAYSWSEIRRWWQPFGWQLLGQRLRPCPGCAECDPCMIGYGSFCGGDPRLFTPDETRSTEQERERHRKHCEEWSSGKRLTATDSDKLVEQAPYGLGVSRWTNNSAGTFCDGSGVIPAKARKVRR